MAKELVARGQATIITQQDAYTITQSVGEYIFPAAADGEIMVAVSFASMLQVVQHNKPITAFTIGTITKPTGFASIVVDNTKKCITFTVAAGTTSLAAHGSVVIPVIISGVTYNQSFVWSKACAGPSGNDANRLDWVDDWNSSRTQIDAETVITPKLFAGTKNANGTLTGVAIGSFAVSSRDNAGNISSQVISGICGFRDGYRTFSVESDGSAQLGRGDQFIKYNAITGKVEFGAAVSLLWVGATYIDKNGIFTGKLSASTVSTITLSATQITSGTISADRIDVAGLKATLITAGNIEALTLAVTKGRIGCWSIDTNSIFCGAKSNATGTHTSVSGEITIGSAGIRGFKWRLEASGAGAIAGGNISWDANGHVTFSSSVSLAWTQPLSNITSALGGDTFPKLTKITAVGIYTGAIDAVQITTGSLSADRIAAGSIKAEKLDATSIKANLINADYISGLGCSFVSGKIGGWQITGGAISAQNIQLCSTERKLIVYASSGNSSVQMYYISDSDFGFSAVTTQGGKVLQLGSTNKIAGWNLSDTTISKGNIALGADGSITNISKWKLNNDGSGVLAAGNISWDAAGTVSFSSSVSLNWSAPISNITTALGGASFPKMTHISSAGIYTGTLTAGQVNAVSISASSITSGTLSADRIAAGSIKSNKLDVADIKACIINTDYINGLNCSFVRGSIGGWMISNGSIGSVYASPLGGPMSICFNSLPTGAGAWKTGSCKPMGAMISWYQPSNAGHLIMGEVAGANGDTKEGFAGIQMMDWIEQKEYFCLSANYALTGSMEVYNRIAGWAFDDKRIWKNSVSLGADGSIVNGAKWQLNNDGSGAIANGNISWDKAGLVSFSDAVSLLWTEDVKAALSSGQIYISARGLGFEDSSVIKVNGIAVAENCIDGISVVSLRRSDMAVLSVNYFDTYGSYEEYNQFLALIKTFTPDNLMIIATWGFYNITPEAGAILQDCGCSEVFFEEGYALAFIGIPGIGRNRGLTAFSEHSEQHIELSTMVVNGTPQGMNVDTYLKTFINGNGIYTGTVHASQIRVDSTLIVGGLYNGSISVRNASGVAKVTLDRTGITAVAGVIGGWALGQNAISALAPESGHRVVLADTGYFYNDNPNTSIDYWGLHADGTAVFGCGTSRFERSGAGFVAGGNFSWDAQGNLKAKNGTFDNVILNGTIRNAFILNDSTIHIGGTDPQMNFNRYDHVVAISSGGWLEDIPLPWTLDHSGRRVCLLNYKWRTNTTIGFMDIMAPSGKYFYEDGIAKRSIRFSRELVELLGYGDDQTFFGWIVVNRIDLMTQSKYGSYQKVLVSGTVTTASNTSCTIAYKTFDGTNTLSITRLGVGLYRVYLPYAWTLNSKYMVMLSGIYSAKDNTPIYATLKKQYTYYFDVQTSDDSSANDGSFSFQVISTADWDM